MFIWPTLICEIPGTIMLCWIASESKNLADAENQESKWGWEKIVLTVIGVASIAITLFCVVYYSCRFKNMVKEKDDEQLTREQSEDLLPGIEVDPTAAEGGAKVEAIVELDDGASVRS